MSQEVDPHPGSSHISMGRVFAIVVVPVIALVMFGLGMVFDWQGFLAGWGDPRIMTVTGQITLNGEPIPAGFLETLPENANLPGARANIEPAGKFTLMTKGKSGAYVGKHKVAVVGFEVEDPTAFLLPREFSELASTPLVIEVSEDASRNHIVLALGDQRD